MKFLKVITNFFLDGSLLFFLLANTVLLFPFLSGLDYRWDWNFPIYHQDAGNIFWNFSNAWNSFNFGQTLSYSSDFFFRFLLYLFSVVVPFLQPEKVCFIVLVVSFSVSQYYFRKFLLIIEKENVLNTLNKSLFLVIAFFWVYNPFIFIKILAGHIDYIVSLSFFSALLFLLFSLRINYALRTLVACALIFALSGAQIQFFPMEYLIIVMFYGFFFPKKILHTAIFPVIAILINLPWLIGFLTGSENILTAGGAAAQNSFTAASQISLLDIFSFNLGDVYNVQKFFPWQYFFLVSLLLIVSFLSVFLFPQKNKQRYRLSLFFLGVFVLGTFLVTGTSSPFGGLKEFFYSFKVYAMFREVGHFYILFLVSILAIWRMAFLSFKGNILKYGVIVFLMTLIIINISVLHKNAPIVDYSFLRNQFPDPSNIASTTIRVAQYPALGPFRSIKFSNDFTFAGWNPIVRFSKLNYVSEEYIPTFSLDKRNLVMSIQGGNPDRSLMYKYNIGYIQDSSNIHQSVFNRYVPSSVSGPADFYSQQNLLKQTLGDTVNNTYDFSDSIPGLIYTSGEGDNNSQVIFSKISSVKYHISLKEISAPIQLFFLENYHNSFKLYSGDFDTVCKGVSFQYKTSGSTECLGTENERYKFSDISYFFKRPLFDDSHKIFNDYANEWTIDPEYIKKNFTKDQYHENSDGSIDLDLTLYFKPQSYFYLGLIISGATLAGCLGYLGYIGIRSWRKKIWHKQC